MSANNKVFEEAIKLLDSEIKIAELNSKPKVADFGKTIYKIDDTEYFKKRLETLTFIKATLKQFMEGDCGEDVKEAIKRLRQETCPATYMPDFDKEKYLQVIEQALQHKSLAERCWEIVKVKRVSIVYLEDSLDVEQYNEFAFQTKGYASQLTKAEFEMLKEGVKEWKKN